MLVLVLMLPWVLMLVLPVVLLALTVTMVASLLVAHSPTMLPVVQEVKKVAVKVMGPPQPMRFMLALK
jgi:hypothetical protein